MFFSGTKTRQSINLTNDVPFGNSGISQVTVSCDGLGETTRGSEIPSGALSTVLAVDGSLVLHPPPVQA